MNFLFNNSFEFEINGDLLKSYEWDIRKISISQFLSDLPLSGANRINEQKAGEVRPWSASEVSR